MKDIEHIRLVINSIENSLYDDLDIKKISEASYISVAQLYRDFYSVTGHSVKEYIRKRRLSNALALVRHSQLSIAEITDRCGYTSTEVFYKTVKKSVHVTPAAYRNGDGFFYFPANSGRECRQVAVAKMSIPDMFQVCRVSGSSETECVRLFQKQFPRYEGRLFGRESRQPGYYELYASVSPDGDQAYTRLPASTGTFATTTVENSPSLIQAAWNYMYYDWMEASMFRHAPTPFFEEYLFVNGNPKKLRLYIPVQKRSGTFSITVEKMESAYYLVCSMRGENAEERAASTLLEYLDECRGQDYIYETKQIYIRKTSDECICGIRLDVPTLCSLDQKTCLPNWICEPAPSYIRTVSTDDGEYGVLSGKCCGDYMIFADTLAPWTQETFGAAGPPFALYDISGGIRSADMKIYCKCH